MDLLYWQKLEAALTLPFGYFINPEKRVFWVYLLSSFCISYFVFLRTPKQNPFFKYLLPKKIWFSQSTKVDLGFFFLNAFVKIFLIAPFFILSLYLSHHLNEFFLTKFGLPPFTLSREMTYLSFSVCFFLLNDLTSFLVHYCFHKIPFLWKFHAVHHSATSMTPFTLYRIHPIEILFNNFRALFILGLCTGVFDYLSKYPIEKITLFGVGIFAFFFHLLGSNLRHSHIPFKYPAWLEKIFISPYQHQIHHSDQPLHFNKNMGSKLALWDLFFGTLVLSKQAPQIQPGLGGKPQESMNSFFQNLLRPFQFWKKL